MSNTNDRLYRKKPGGTWYGWYFTPNGRSHYLCLKTKDRRTAKAKLLALEREATERVAQGEPHTLMAAMDEFLAEGCADLSAATVRMYTQKGRHLLRLLDPALDITTLTRDEVQRYITTRRREGAHQGTIFKEIVTLRRCLTHAFDASRLQTDPKVLIPRIKNKYQPRRRYLTEEQFKRLVGELLPHRAWWATMAVYTGARRSELERILVEEHIDLRGGWLTIPGTKTDQAQRVIPLNEHLRALLRRDAPTRGPLVRHWGSVNRDLEAACARAGIPRVSPNDLRRTFASWLKQAGQDSFVVARLLGHTTSTMVERVYGHLGNDNYRNAVEQLPDVTSGRADGEVARIHSEWR